MSEKQKIKKIIDSLKNTEFVNLDNLHYSFPDEAERKYRFIKESTPIAVNRFKYRAYKEVDQYGSKDICLTPVNLKGDKACASVEYNDYAYTHGGRTFRKAVDYAKEIKQKIIKEKQNR